MSVFDVTSVQSGLQSAATTVATSLVPKRQAAALPVVSGTAANGATAKAATTTTGSTTTTSSTTATNSGTISSNDFLTLLVSELKNQDPTQPTDPNAYISQLVGVNSLQQLIAINQGLTTIEPTTTAATPSTPTTPAG